MTYGIFSTFLYFLKLRNRILREPYIIPTYMDNICNMVCSVYSLCISSFSAKRPHLSTKEPYLFTKEPNLATKEVYFSTKELYPSTKEPHLVTKEPYLSTKEPNLSTKEPNLATKEPYLSAKKLYLSTKEPNLATKELYNWAIHGPYISSTYYMTYDIFSIFCVFSASLQDIPVSQQKSPKWVVYLILTRNIPYEMVSIFPVSLRRIPTRVIHHFYIHT